MKKRKVVNLVIVFLLVASTFIIFNTGDVTAQEYSGEIWTTDENGNTRDYLSEGSKLYYTINLDQGVDANLIVDYYDDLDEPRIRRDDPVSVINGEYEAHEDPLFFNPLELTEEFEEIHLILRDEDGVEIDQDNVEVYEPDFQHSKVITTEDDYETEKNYYFEGDWIYFRADMEDQFGWPPEEEPEIEVVVEKDGEVVQTQPPNIGPGYDEDEGKFYGDFRLQEYVFGNYTLRIMDDDDDIEYASTEFTVINLEVYLVPEVEDDLYTQEQEIEIRVESNYDDNITVFIADDDEAPYEIMDGARWEDQELLNNFWSTEYTIPENEEDGTYYVIVNSTENEERLGVMEFEIQKYSLEVVTDKDVYLPGEEVKAFYTVSNLLDGSEYQDVYVEWMMEYETEEGEEDSLTGEGIDGEFTFILPEDAAVEPQTFPPQPQQRFKITVWADDTEERYQDEVEIEKIVGDLDLNLDVEYDEYFVGQTLYIELETSTGNVDVEVELHHDDEVFDDRNVETDGSGYYMVTIDLSGKNPGHYVVIGTATWNDMEDTDDDDFELLEESRRLSVMLETDKGVNPYYPGEQGTVFYTVTHQGETVTNDVNVKYTLSSDERVLDYGFADEDEIDFTVPDEYRPSVEGWMEMHVEATLDRETHGESNINILVSIGEIILNPSQWEYEAEDEIHFEYEFYGIERGEIDSLEYRVLDPYNELIMSGTPTDGFFELVMPENPARYYRVELEAVTNAGASIETVEWIYRISGFFLRTEIVTDSDYTTGIYEPGDEIEMSYELVSRDGSPLPETVTVEYGIQGYPESFHSFRTTETKGTVTFTIPELNDGEQILSIQVSEGGNVEIIDVDNDPSLLNRKVLGSVSLSGLMTAIFLIIALIIACIAFYRTQSRKLGPSKKPRQTQEMGRTEIPSEEEGGEGFYIEEGESKQENQWSGIDQEEQSQIDSEE